MVDEIDKYFRAAYLFRCFNFSRTSDNHDKKLITKVFAPLKRFTMHVSTNKKKKPVQGRHGKLRNLEGFF